ncbi:MAG TPA: hypothetical protein VM581_02805 [Magnetospirillaceae bacterium]|nr:hypothetical protein [Magnetospirillaceae bacterium]
MGEVSRRLAIRAASTRGKVAVRIGGGVRSLSSSAVAMMNKTIVPAFAGCDFTLIAGGTRTELRLDGAILPGITEVLPLIGAVSPLAKTVGVIPRQTDLRLVHGRLIVADKPQNDHITIVHPDLNTCLLLQYSVDKGLDGWDAEWLTALDLMEALRLDGGYRTLHLFYGGGKTTERELLHVLNLSHSPANPWWVVLVADSGGVVSQYAADKSWCSQFAGRLAVCGASELSTTLRSLGFNPLP